MRKRAMTWRAAAVGLALVVVAGCGAGTTDASSGSGAGGGSGEEIDIGTGIDASYSPFFLADQKGMFKNAGLNVKVVQFGRGGDAVQAIAGGRVQLAGNSATTTLTLIPQNPDLRALLIYEESGKYLKIVARPGITSADQIKKMGVVPGLSELGAIKYFQAHNIDPKSVKFVSADPPELPALTQKGDVDAYLLWEPWPANGVKLGLHELAQTGDYGFTYVHWLVASNKWLQGHKQAATKLAEVLQKATKEVAKDPAAAAQATEAATKAPVEQSEQLIPLITWQVRDFTDHDMQVYQDRSQYFVDSGTLKSIPDYKTTVLKGWLTNNVKGG